MGNCLNGNGNYLYLHGNLFRQVLYSGKLIANIRCQSFLCRIRRLPRSSLCLPSVKQNLIFPIFPILTTAWERERKEMGIAHLGIRWERVATLGMRREAMGTELMRMGENKNVESHSHTYVHHTRLFDVYTSVMPRVRIFGKMQFCHAAIACHHFKCIANRKQSDHFWRSAGSLLFQMQSNHCNTLPVQIYKFVFLFSNY